METNDIIVESWTELLQALYDIPKTRHQRYRSDFVYRGVADHSWGLETSLKRLGGDYVNVERPLLRSFRKYAEPGSIPADTLWVRLAVAQHHGLPTRVLDWTVSPKVALHFATAEEEHYDKDGAICCIDIAQARSLLAKTLLVVLASDLPSVTVSSLAAQTIHTLRKLKQRFGARRFLTSVFASASEGTKSAPCVALQRLTP